MKVIPKQNGFLLDFFVLGTFLLELFSWRFLGSRFFVVLLVLAVLLFEGGLLGIVALLFVSCVGGLLARMFLLVLGFLVLL